MHQADPLVLGAQSADRRRLLGRHPWMRPGIDLNLADPLAQGLGDPIPTRG
jgi:hypothetical protein